MGDPRALARGGVAVGSNFTLRDWRDRFLAHRDAGEQLYDSRFVRMWDSISRLRKRHSVNKRRWFSTCNSRKRQGAAPLPRDYIPLETARLRALEDSDLCRLRLAGE
jgi:cyclopropane-fatty-acyl-phospholipid synthase